MLKKYKELAKNWNNLKSDDDRFQFLIDHSDEMKIVLDNDCSHVTFIIDDDMESEIADILYDIELKDFDDDNFYYADGVLNLFAFVGITAEVV